LRRQLARLYGRRTPATGDTRWTIAEPLRFLDHLEMEAIQAAPDLDEVNMD
jgi:hypothetical protein